MDKLIAAMVVGAMVVTLVPPVKAEEQQQSQEQLQQSTSSQQPQQQQQEQSPEQQQQENASSATAVSPQGVESSTGPVKGNFQVLNTAIGDLNYKIELMQSRYMQLNGDIDDLRSTDEALRKMIAEDRLSIPDPRQLKNLEAEAEATRSDLAQLHEEMTGLRSDINKLNVPETKEDKLLHSPWIGVTALGLSLIAVFMR